MTSLDDLVPKDEQPEQQRDSGDNARHKDAPDWWKRQQEDEIERRQRGEHGND